MQGRVDGKMCTCVVCQKQEFVERDVNTEAGMHERGWYCVVHLGASRNVCKECYQKWDSMNRSFLKIVKEENEDG